LSSRISSRITWTLEQDCMETASELNYRSLRVHAG
jgi:hypothetical protein